MSDFAKLRDLWSLEGAPTSLAGGLTYAKGMHGRPFDYYVARIRNLGISGQRALDAGCGTGTWSFALRAVFDEVIGIDYTEERVRAAQWLAEKSGVTGIEFRVASVLDTGLPDQSVDAIFCYSVLISSLSAEDTLKEFRRVLKPGGLVYVSFNGLGWSFYLRDVRGKNDAKIADMGRQGIYNTLVRSLPEPEFNAIALRYSSASPTQVNRTAEPTSHVRHFAKRVRGKLVRTARALLSNPAGVSISYLKAREEIAQWSAYLSPDGMPPSRLAAIADLIRKECGERYVIQLAVDLAAISARRQAEFSHANAGRGYDPDEMRAICERAGLIDFQWAPEGMLTGANLADPPKPIHEAYVGGHLKVWDFIAFRPDDTLGAQIGPDWFRDNAVRVAKLPYLAPARMPIQTNVDATAIAPGWVEEARRRATAAGGDRLIAGLAEKLCLGAVDDEDRAVRLIRFVQDVLVRNPIVQPFQFNGAAVTDPATLLFLGIGRCGAAAPLAAALFAAAGIKARVETLPGHVFVVAYVGGTEVLVETDYFKKGVIPRGSDGKLIRYDEFRGNPAVADSLPNFPLWWMEQARSATDIWGRKPFGYIETADDMRIYSSYFDPKATLRYKPKVPRLSVDRAAGAFRLSWSDATPVDGAAVDYRIVARTVSRGWDYEQEPSDITPIEMPAAAVAEHWTDDLAATIDAPEGAFFDVTPRLKDRPDVFCWPSAEASAPGKTGG